MNMPGIAGPSAGEARHRRSEEGAAERPEGYAAGQHTRKYATSDRSRQSFSYVQVGLAFIVAMVASVAIHSTIFSDKALEKSLQPTDVVSRGAASTYFERLVDTYKRRLTIGYKKLSNLFAAQTNVKGSHRKPCGNIESRQECVETEGEESSRRIQKYFGLQ
jgi:hypothetical protein